MIARFILTIFSNFYIETSIEDCRFEFLLTVSLVLIGELFLFKKKKKKCYSNIACLIGKLRCLVLLVFSFQKPEPVKVMTASVDEYARK